MKKTHKHRRTGQDIVIDLSRINNSAFSAISAHLKQMEAWFFIAMSIITIAVSLAAFLALFLHVI